MMREIKNTLNEIQGPRHLKLLHTSKMLNPNDISVWTVQDPLPLIKFEANAGFIALWDCTDASRE